MPDIPERSKKEAQLALLLRRAFGRTRLELIDALGLPPDVGNVPNELWEQIRQHVEDDTRNAISIVLLLSMLRMAKDHGWYPEPESAADIAGDYAVARSKRLADSVVNTFKDRLTTAIEESKSRLDSGDTAAKIKRNLIRRAREIAKEQAENAGATETTAANTEGEVRYADAHEAETGVKLVGTWHVEPGACKICRPLSGAVGWDWQRRFPEGPPQPHANCRCWLTWKAVRTLSAAVV